MTSQDYSINSKAEKLHKTMTAITELQEIENHGLHLYVTDYSGRVFNSHKITNYGALFTSKNIGELENSEGVKLDDFMKKIDAEFRAGMVSFIKSAEGKL